MKDGMKIAIVGAGKMGAWLARELARDQEHMVAAYDKDPEQLKPLEGVRPLASLAELQEFQPELLINAVSLQHTIPAFESVLVHLPRTCLIADVASIKGELPKFYAKAGLRFVSVHPMFGPTFATMDSLREENAVIIQESDHAGKTFFRDFFAKRGVRVFDFTFDEHDRMMAYSLSTPFASSLVFAACMDKAIVPGSTFSRHRKIARGLLSEDDHLLAEILFNPYTLPQLDKITARLEFLKHIIRGRDFEEAKRFFDKLRQNVE